MVATAQEIVDAAFLSNEVYDTKYNSWSGGEIGNGWRLVSRQELGMGGLADAALFNGDYLYDVLNLQAFVARNETTDQAAIVFRGTDFVYAVDLVTDLLLPLYLPTSYATLTPLTNAFKGYVENLSNGVTEAFAFGHSLGGALAEMFMAFNGSAIYSSVTFGSPGIPLPTAMAHGFDNRVTHLYGEGDPVAHALFIGQAVTSSIGANLPIDLPDVSAGFGEHSMQLYLDNAKLLQDSGLLNLRASQSITILDGRNDSFGNALSNKGLLLLGAAGDDTLAGGSARDLIGGGANNDIIRGNGGDDVLFGQSGDDNLTGGAGNDTLDGGESSGDTDIAIYSGKYSEYIVSTSNGVTTVKNTVGFEGIDTVTNVEFFKFGTGPLIAVENVDTPPPIVSAPVQVVPVRETVTVTNSPPPPPPPSAPPTIYTSGSFSFAEGDSGLKFGTVRVYLNKVVSTDVSFNYTFAGQDSVGWAKFGSDFQLTAGTATILAGSTYVELKLPVIGDSKIEGDESLWLLLGGAQGAVFAGGAPILTVNGTIRDNDVPAVPPPPPQPAAPPHGPIYLSLEADDASLFEGPGGTVTEFTFTAYRTGDLSVATNIRYEVIGFGATPATASDFEGNVFPVSNDVMAVGQTFDEFIVRVKGDFITEANEAFQVKLIAESPGVKVTDRTAAVTIRNDDGSTLPTPAGNVYVSIAAYDAHKFEGTSGSGSTPFVFEVRRDGDLNQETQVGVSIRTPGATPQASGSGDFFASAFTVTFAIGQSVAYVTFNGRPDSINEPDELLTVELSSKSGYSNVIFTDKTADGLIQNDDGPAPPLVTAPSIAVLETDGNQTTNLRVELSHTTSVAVTMNYSVYAYASSQIPTLPGVDFTELTGTITILPGNSFAEIPITIIGDNIAESFEIVDVRLSNLVNGYFGRSLSEWDTSVVVLDDDGEPWPGFSELTSADYVNLGEVTNYSSQHVNYWLDDTTPYQIFAFEVVDPIVVQAIPFNSPYFLFSQSGTLIESRASRVDGIEVTDVRNSLAEGAALQSGQYFLVMQNPSDNTGSNYSFDFNGVPTPNQLPMLTFDPVIVGSLPYSTGQEGASAAININMSFVQDSDITFDVQFRSLTATAGLDFNSTNFTMTIAAGETSSNVQFITLFNDAEFEGNETFEVVLKNVTGALLPNGQSEWTTTLTIIDTDASPLPIFIVNDLAARRAEGTASSGLFSFEVSRPFGGENVAGSVEWNVIGSGANPAMAVDFVGNTLPSGTVTFSAGEISKTIVVQVAADAIAEFDEGFTVLLNNPSVGFGVFNGGSEGVILNDDGAYQPGYLDESSAESALSYGMSTEETAFYLSGVASSDVYGNEEDNRIAGNNAANWISSLGGNDTVSGEGGNDTLDGGSGADLLIGGEGDDLFYVDDVGDEAVEAENQGTDHVISSVSFELAPSIEMLELSGSGNINASGNEIANTLKGNAGSNTLAGGAGNDLLEGDAGHDFLLGGAGDDELDGGQGIDVAIFEGKRAEYEIYELVDGKIEIAGQGFRSEDGVDTLNDIENFRFNGVTYNVEQLFNELPTLENPIDDQIAVEDVSFVYQFAADVFDDTDPGTVLLYSATLANGNPLPTWLAFNSSTRTFSGTPRDSDVGLVSIKVTAIDGLDIIDDFFTISVTDVVDIITGSSANNTLTGTTGTDVIDGLAGNDILIGLGGADQLTGGLGTDTASYAASAAGVNVSLMTGVGTGGDAEGDTLFTIENLTGSNLDDTLEGSAGNNVLAGGLGTDTVSYANALAGVTVSLALATAQNTLGAGSDTLSGFENLTGSGLNDTLTGSTGNNVLRGGAGNDTLNGGGGSDTFDFSSLTNGNDVITDFLTGTDDIGLADLLDASGLGDLDYATLISQGNLVIQTGFFATGLASNSAAIQDTQIYIDADGIGAGGSVLIATLEDTLTSANDFLV